jgi:hypothetical protein
LTGVTGIAAGSAHSVALRSDGSVVCWGDNKFGQCTVPAGLGAVTAVAAGDGHTLALLTTGQVVAWGNNENGQTQIPEGLDGVQFIDGGFNRSLAVKASGEIVVWGEGAAGLNASLAAYSPPVTISAGAYHVAALKAPVDTDADGLDDSLEARLGTNPESKDSDGDQLEDGVEYLAGFDPLAPTEAVDGATSSEFAVRLRTFTLPVGQYRIFGSTDLLTWTRVGGTIRNRRGYSDLLLEAGSEVRFFRLDRIQ